MFRLLTVAAFLLGISLTLAHADEPTKQVFVEVTGHVLAPKKLEPTDADVASVKVPTGFKVEKFAEGLINPRILAVGDDGTVYATRRSVGDVIMLKDTDGDGKADLVKTVASRPNMHGIAIDGRKVYLVTIKEVYVADIRDDGSFGPLTRIVDDLPDAGQHADRTIAMGPDKMLYISVGSTCNVCIEDNAENATMLQMKPDGTGRRILASGLRNTIGFAFAPSTGELYGFDHGIDWLGDDDQPEEMNLIKEGHKYGWPYIYGASKRNVQHHPPAGITHEDWARSSDEPELMYTAHAAPMQLAFYTGTQFPAQYRGDAFIAMHGSWNRKPPSGYEVLRVHFEDGRPKSLEPFMTGFLTQTSGGEYGYFGRPFGIAIGKDGSLLVGDDANGAIYRVIYETPKTAENNEMTTTPSTNAALAEQDTPKQLSNEILQAKPSISVASPAFGPGEKIDVRYSAYGENISPELSWSAGPDGTQSYAIIVEDPDAPKPKPVVHWTIFNIPADVTHLREGVPGSPALTDPKDARQGLNTHGATGYFGPRPPGSDPHHYHFQVFALDTKLDLKPGPTRKDMLAAMKGHVLAQGELVGVFQKPANANGS